MHNEYLEYGQDCLTEVNAYRAEMNAFSADMYRQLVGVARNLIGQADNVRPENRPIVINTIINTMIDGVNFGVVSSTKEAADRMRAVDLADWPAAKQTAHRNRRRAFCKSRGLNTFTFFYYQLNKNIQERTAPGFHL